MSQDAAEPPVRDETAAIRVTFDELKGLSGRELGWSRWRPVTQAMVDGFAAVTGDHAWIHVDRQRAADGPYGGTIAHGFLTLALVPVLCADIIVVTDADLINYGLSRVRFPSPVLVGKDVRMKAAMGVVGSIGPNLRTSIAFEIWARDGIRPAATGDQIVIGIRRPAGPA